MVYDDTGTIAEAIGQDTNRYISNSRVDDGYGPDSLPIDAVVAADVEGNGASFNLDLMPVESPVQDHLHRRDAVLKPEVRGRVLLGADPPADGATLELDVGNEAPRPVLGEDADVGY